MNMPKIDTSSIISVILAIALAFTTMGGMTANIEDTVSFDAKVSLDAEALLAVSGANAEIPEELAEAYQQQIEEQKQTMKVVGDIISALTVRGVASKDAAEAVILAGESTALSLGVKQGDAGVIVASSLLPSDVIFVSDDLIRQMQDQMAKQQTQAQAQLQQAQSAQAAAAGLDLQAISGALEKLDKDQIAKDIEETLQKLDEGIEAKKGETETGEFTVDGMVFVSRTPINMTYPEFAEYMLTGAKELVSKESLKPLADAAGKDLAAEIDKKIGELKNQPETDWPETFELAVYTDAANGAYTVCDAVTPAKAGAADKEELHIAFGEIGGLNRTNIIRNQGEEQMDIAAAGTKDGAFDLTANIVNKTANGEIKAGRDEAGNLDMTCNIHSGTQDAKIEVNTEKQEGGRTGFRFAVYFTGAEKPLLTLSGSFGKGGELISVFEGEKITATPAETLMDGESTEASAFSMKMIAGVLKIVTVVSKNVPEETGKWISTKITEAMTPKTTTTEAPAEQPAVDGE